MFEYVLETERLKLYPMNEAHLARAAGDLRGVAGLFGAVMTGQGFGFFEMVEKRRIYRAKRALIQQSPKAWLLSTMWLAVDKGTSEVIGEAGFKGPPRCGEVEVGYSTRLPFRSKGYMTEIVSRLCAFAFAQDVYRVSAVCALTNSDNLASQSVLRKNGFVHDGMRGKYWYWRKTEGSARAEAARG